jgi:hypothetical protein
MRKRFHKKRRKIRKPKKYNGVPGG